MKLPTSPFNTRQEEYRDDRWKMMMICFMLNQTSHKQVDQIRHEFFDRFPTPEKLVLAEDADIVEIIKPLGFYNKRAKAWKEFSMQWIEAVRENGDDMLPLSVLEKMKGVGKYALDSWKVFQLYEYDTQVEDHVLNWYVDWARIEVENQKRESSPMKPWTVYYLHCLDERGALPNWKQRKDYVCCVNARTMQEAIEKTKAIALAQEGARYIKIMGIGHAKEEWVNEQAPLVTDEALYQEQIRGLFKRIEAGRLADPEGPNKAITTIVKETYESKYGKNGSRS